MKVNRKLTVLVLVVAVLSISLFATVGSSLDLGDVITVGGVSFLVSQYGGQIDKYINKTLGERKAEIRGQTKVVPILSIGRGGYIGACQVVGEKKAVQSVKAVVQVESRFGSLQGKVYLPIATKDVTKAPERVSGTGVSAVIEFKI